MRDNIVKFIKYGYYEKILSNIDILLLQIFNFLLGTIVIDQSKVYMISFIIYMHIQFAYPKLMQFDYSPSI